MSWLTDVITAIKPYTSQPKIEPYKPTTTAKSSTTYFSNGYQPNNINGNKLTAYKNKEGKVLTIGDTNLKGTKNQNGTVIDNQKIWTDGKNQYIWIGNGKSSGGYYAKINVNNGANRAIDFTDKTIATLGKEDSTLIKGYDFDKNKGLSAAYYDANESFNGPTSPNPNSSNNKQEALTGAITGSPIANSKPSSSKTNVNKTTKTNTTEKSKLATVEEMARDYGIDVDYNNILKDFNQQTEDYYDLVIDEQNRIRDRIARDNQLYDDNILNNYIESYANASNSTVNQAARAATLLSSDLNNSYNSAVNDYALLQSIHEQEQARKKELAQNKLEAKTYENQLRQWLLDGAATKNNSDVNAYVADQGALANRYAADRSYQAGLANAAATKYAGLVNANATTQAFDNSMKQQLYDYYKSIGVNPDTSVANTFKYSQGIVK